MKPDKESKAKSLMSKRFPALMMVTDVSINQTREMSC
jgi:hypothetical protein